MTTEEKEMVVARVTERVLHDIVYLAPGRIERPEAQELLDLVIEVLREVQDDDIDIDQGLEGA